MSKNKVLILVNHDVVIYNFRKELVERLLEDNYEVYISSPYGERIDNLIEMGCKYIEASIERRGTNIFKEFKLLVYYIKIIKQVDPDIVLSYTIKPNIYGGMASELVNVPYITNITGLGTAVKNGGIIQKISIMLYKIAFFKVNKVFFQNKGNQNFFINHSIATNKHRLVPGSGVNLDHFKLLEYPSDAKIKFLFMSRIMQEKGIEEFLEAAKYFTNKYNDVEFYICGFCEEEYEKRLENLEEEGIINYHGMLRDVREILAKVHCVILPSYHEGMSNVLLESASCGRPIIASDINGCKETINDGVNGFLIKPKSSDDLIDKIKNFLNLDYKEKRKMGLEGRKKVENEFDRQIVVDAYMEEIEKAIK